MTVVATVLALAALLLAVALAIVVAAMLRAVDRLRAEIAGLRDDRHAPIDPMAGAISVGAAAPEFTATAFDRSGFASSELSGTLRVLAFARPGCAPCEELVPALLRAAERGELPPSVVVSRGGPADQPEAWRAGGARARVVMEDEDRVSELFGSVVSPQVFVLTADNRVGARGIATGAEDVRRLVAEAADRVPA